MPRKPCNNSTIAAFTKLYSYKIAKLNAPIAKPNKRFVNVECLFFLYSNTNIAACTIALIINPHVVKSGIFEIASIKNTAFALNIAKRGSSIKLLSVNICQNNSK